MIPLKDAVFTWDEKKCLVIEHNNHRDFYKILQCDWGACNLFWGKISASKRHSLMMRWAWEMVMGGKPAEMVHQALSVIPEYRKYMDDGRNL